MRHSQNVRCTALQRAGCATNSQRSPSDQPYRYLFASRSFVYPSSRLCLSSSLVREPASLQCGALFRTDTLCTRVVRSLSVCSVLYSLLLFICFFKLLTSRCCSGFLIVLVFMARWCRTSVRKVAHKHTLVSLVQSAGTFYWTIWSHPTFLLIVLGSTQKHFYFVNIDTSPSSTLAH